MTNKSPINMPKFNELSLDKPLKTTEEFDCERRGYKLTKTCLGAGAYAKVKLAYVTNAKLEKDKRLAEELKEKGTNKVAVKVISRKSAPKEYINKFMPREIETLHATYRFPNIIQLYETFRTDNRVYLIMEYASKGDLLEYINSRSGKTPGVGETKAKHFFRQIVSGIQHCHRRNVVHRDLKCENLLIDDDEVLKISDFGFATRFPTNKQKLLETFCGSYAYAAPEILQAEKYDGKIADIWSLGIILFAMLNGRLPYNDRDIRTLIEQTKGKPRFSSRVQVSAECQDLVCKILTSDPIKRTTIHDILRHPWLAHSNMSQDKLSRGIPDGKSDEIVANESAADDEFPKYNAKNKYTNQACTERVLNRERWACKGPEPQAMQKLLHSRTTKLSTEDQTNPSVESLDKKENPVVKVISKPKQTCWDEKNRKTTDRKSLITEMLPNKYQPEPVVKKIAFGGNNPSRAVSSVSTTYRLSPNKRPKNPTVVPVMVSNTKSKDCFKPVSKQGRKDACILPPVCANIKSVANKKSNSTPVKCQQQQNSDHLKQTKKSTRPSTRQASAQIPKQFKTKAIQNFTFNQPGINIEVVSLRRNWQKLKQTAAAVTYGAKLEDSKAKNNRNNIELTYYTLSGKEVNVRCHEDQHQRPLSMGGTGYGR